MILTPIYTAVIMPLALGMAPCADHARLDAFLQKCVVGDGVDYRAAKQQESVLQEYVAALADADLGDVTGDQKKALFINAYNAATLLLILEYWSPEFKSIKDIPEEKRWKHRRWNVGGKVYSLDDMEHQVLRAEFNDFRIHAAINCASVGCPALRANAYCAEDLDAQLDDQARRFVNNRRYVRVQARVLNVSAIFDWFKEDVASADGSALGFVQRYADRSLLRALDILGPGVTIKFLDYDWSLNASSAPATYQPPKR